MLLHRDFTNMTICVCVKGSSSCGENCDTRLWHHIHWYHLLICQWWLLLTNVTLQIGKKDLSRDVHLYALTLILLVIGVVPSLTSELVFQRNHYISEFRLIYNWSLSSQLYKCLLMVFSLRWSLSSSQPHISTPPKHPVPW